jgi:hypothetical protein
VLFQVPHPKNGQNGENKLFALNTSGKCFISTYAYEVMGVYQIDDYIKSIQFVIAPDIEWAMRRVAARVYRLHLVQEKKAF